MPDGQDNPARAQPVAGKVRVDQKTLDQFSQDQAGALQQANMDRTIKGLPAWLVPDFVRSHPDKFPEVDFELDHQEHAARVVAAPPPPDNRIDQRKVG